MSNKTILIGGAFGGLVLFFLLILFLGGEEAQVTPPDTLVVTELPPPPVAVTQPEPVTLTMPATEIPEPEIVTAEPEVPGVTETAPTLPEPDPLPGLNESDPYVLEQVGTLQNSNAVQRQLTSMQILRKFVVLVDGMSRGEVPDRDLPVIRGQGNVVVNEVNEEFYRLDPATYTRFNLLANTFAAMDARQLAALYRDMSPLFDTAYAELGYRDRQFSNVLAQAIDSVLAVQLPVGEVLLTRPSVHYRFADPGLEARSDLEKLFIRMGPENTARIQAKVRELKPLLVR